jgi:lipoteichoic acid synthase
LSHIRCQIERLTSANAGALVVPLALFALLDGLCRLQLAWLLELHRPWASFLPALRATALGVGVDLVFVLPVYAAYALAPYRTTRALTTAVFALALAILIADAVYFFHTFEHIEPVVFNNVNRFSILGAATGVAATGPFIAALGFIAIVFAHGIWHRHTAHRRSLSWGLSLAVASAASATLGFSSTRIEMPKAEKQIESFLNETRDAYLAKVSAPILGGFFRAMLDAHNLERSPAPAAPLAYAADERTLLEEHGLLRTVESPTERKPAFDRIIFLVMESLPAAYLHHYNPAIPAETAPFLDDLLHRYPHVNRFFTSSMPTDYGLNSLFLSRLMPDWSGDRESLFSVLRSEAGFESHFVRAVSKHYGNQLITYPRIFQFDSFVGFEELQSQYPSQWHSGWGANNATVYEKGLDILSEERESKLVLVLKTIDLHQPGPFQGIPLEYLPESLQLRGEPILNALHWVDQCVRAFFEDLDQRGFFDERTLVVVTSDHGPHPGAEYRNLVPSDEYQRLSRLPLIFVTRNPGALRDLDSEGFASQVDLAPTILELMGVAAPTGFAGRSLLGRDPERFRIGLYQDAFSYASPQTAFAETIEAEGEPGTLRNRAIRKWIHNQNARVTARLVQRSR